MKTLLYRLNSQNWLIEEGYKKALKQQVKAIEEGNLVLPEPEEEPDNMPAQVEPLYDVVGNMAVICFEGPMVKKPSLIELLLGFMDYDNISKALLQAYKDTSIASIMLYFGDAPGGCSVGLQEISDLCAEINKTKPVYSYSDCVLASAAYHIASQGSKIYASPSALVGSIGVRGPTVYHCSTALGQAGIKVTEIYSGIYKNTPCEDHSLRDDERAMLQGRSDREWADFKKQVTRNRTIAEEDMQGQVFTARPDGVNKGLIDGIFYNKEDCQAFLLQS